MSKRHQGNPFQNPFDEADEGSPFDLKMGKHGLAISIDVGRLAEMMAEGSVDGEDEFTRDPDKTLFANLIDYSRTHKNTDLIRGVERESDCCSADARDGLILAVPTLDAAETAVAHGANNTPETVVILAVDAHVDEALELKLDVASLERHVNHCTEVLAFIRQRNAEHPEQVARMRAAELARTEKGTD